MLSHEESTVEKSFALSLANRPGTLRKTLRILWGCGVSVTRASYSQSIDVHALFVDITGTRAATGFPARTTCSRFSRITALSAPVCSWWRTGSKCLKS